MPRGLGALLPESRRARWLGDLATRLPGAGPECGRREDPILLVDGEWRAGRGLEAAPLREEPPLERLLEALRWWLLSRSRREGLRRVGCCPRGERWSGLAGGVDLHAILTLKQFHRKAFSKKRLYISVCNRKWRSEFSTEKWPVLDAYEE